MNAHPVRPSAELEAAPRRRPTWLIALALLVLAVMGMNGLLLWHALHLPAAQP